MEVYIRILNKAENETMARYKVYHKHLRPGLLIYHNSSFEQFEIRIPFRNWSLCFQLYSQRGKYTIHRRANIRALAHRL